MTNRPWPRFLNATYDIHNDKIFHSRKSFRLKMTSLFFLQNTMIIEYIGSIIRNEVANKRERIYEDGVSTAFSLISLLKMSRFKFSLQYGDVIDSMKICLV